MSCGKEVRYEKWRGDVDDSEYLSVFLPICVCDGSADFTAKCFTSLSSNDSCIYQIQALVWQPRNSDRLNLRIFVMDAGKLGRRLFFLIC